MPLLFGISRFLEKKYLKNNKTYINIAHLVLAVNSIGAFLLAVALKMAPLVFIVGLPDKVSGLSLFQKIAINIPGIMFILILILLTFFLKVSEKEYWTRNLRIIFIFSISLFCVFEGLIFYWGLFKILL